MMGVCGDSGVLASQSPQSTNDATWRGGGAKGRQHDKG